MMGSGERDVSFTTLRRKRFFSKALPRLVFIDETSTNTKLTKRTGWSAKGERYRTHAPFGQWHTPALSWHDRAGSSMRR